MVVKGISPKAEFPFCSILLYRNLGFTLSGAWFSDQKGTWNREVLLEGRVSQFGFGF